ncbi:uroporphyrinogen decarboxylase family protein [Draconibacterium sp.]|nr:uroporphyrinogen decarboxylase family protein [Draconibacterium sp.]
MTPKERFYATINNQPVDRPATWLGLPTSDAIPGLLKHFNANSVAEIKTILQDDVWPVIVPYNNEPFNDIGCALNFAKTGEGGTREERTLTAPGYFENMTDPEEVEKYSWPNPKYYLDVEEATRRAKEIPKDKLRMGIMWSAHFQDSCSAFGMENALITMMMYPEMYQAVIDRITNFYLEINELFYQATKGYLDAVLIGNDFGSQGALMVDPDLLRAYVFEGTKKLVNQAKSYGLTVIHHSCGSIFPVIGDLFEMGVDVIHPIQALAADMDVETLRQNFKNKGAFCGGVDAQELLVNGTPEQILRRVKKIKQVFPTGLVISPSHEDILPDINPANIEAMYEAVHST